ncbi:Hypothetical predicted protein [Mytilus galloprovincialis]|uniref:Uncharacterized protein n=1 Tax=Mytilus galloprovincialis TaxID=29158 RepID=A0A8B6D0F5_MYTGA|nr:Hypothetical predicted protein [Mytilus galloprovincialis]
MVFRTKAKEVREDPFKGMSPDEAANIQINIISNSCALLHSLGYEIAAIAAKDTEPSHVRQKVWSSSRALKSRMTSENQCSVSVEEIHY